ncbi:MAG: hypothetical protein KDD37_03925, partial [Bdellovibrionales bacterium]|nr:hypothetical protein [Bdellovibrionales bacterium]
EKFDLIDARFELIEKRFEHLERKIDFLPFQTTVYQAGVLLVFFGLYQSWPTIKLWIDSFH